MMRRWRAEKREARKREAREQKSNQAAPKTAAEPSNSPNPSQINETAKGKVGYTVLDIPEDVVRDLTEEDEDSSAMYGKAQKKEGVCKLEGRAKQYKVKAGSAQDHFEVKQTTFNQEELEAMVANPRLIAIFCPDQNVARTDEGLLYLTMPHQHKHRGYNKEEGK